MVEDPDIPSGIQGKALKTMLIIKVQRRNADEEISAYTIALAAMAVRDLNNGSRKPDQLALEEEIITIEIVLKFKARWVVKGCSSWSTL